jgi:uncharacterized membrane protein
MYKNISGQIGHTFQTSIIGFGGLLLQSIKLVPLWITIGLPILAVACFVLWVWYNFFR